MLAADMHFDDDFRLQTLKRRMWAAQHCCLSSVKLLQVIKIQTVQGLPTSSNANISVYSNANAFFSVAFKCEFNCFGVALKRKWFGYASVNAFEFVVNVCLNEICVNVDFINDEKESHNYAYYTI